MNLLSCKDSLVNIYQTEAITLKGNWGSSVSSFLWFLSDTILPGDFDVFTSI